MTKLKRTAILLPKKVGAFADLKRGGSDEKEAPFRAPRLPAQLCHQGSPDGDPRSTDSDPGPPDPGHLRRGGRPPAGHGKRHPGPAPKPGHAGCGRGLRPRPVPPKGNGGPSEEVLQCLRRPPQPLPRGLRGRPGLAPPHPSPPARARTCAPGHPFLIFS